MSRFGVGVEGPSDQRFWRGFLRRTFPQHVFDVRSMKTRSRLIHDAPRLLATFHEAGYAAGILVLDLDDNPCVRGLCGLFDDTLQRELRRPLDERYLHLCVAARELESWFLADVSAVRRVLPAVDYEVPGDTREWGHKKLKELWRRQYGDRAIAFNKIDFAERMAPIFDVAQARRHSASLRLAWERIAGVTARLY